MNDIVHKRYPYFPICQNGNLCTPSVLTLGQVHVSYKQEIGKRFQIAKHLPPLLNGFRRGRAHRGVIYAMAPSNFFGQSRRWVVPARAPATGLRASDALLDPGIRLQLIKNQQDQSENKSRNIPK